MVSKEGKLVGLIENKHLPPHNGHKFMCEWSLAHLKTRAQRQGKGHHLYVAVCSRDGEVIDGKLRFEWTKKMLADPNVTVLHANNVLSRFPEYGSDYNNHEMWGRVATEMLGLGDQIDYLYASEDYGPGIAAAAGAEFIPCDKDRSNIPVSGTEVRESPVENWEYIPSVVRPFFAKKVCVFGAEYTGKTKLVDHLSRHFDTVSVPEYAPMIYDNKTRAFTMKDLEEIAEHHLAAEEALLQQTNKLLLSCTDILTTATWAYESFGRCPAWIEQEAGKKKYDLYLFMDPKGLSHTPGNTHPDRESWLRFSDKLMEALESRNRPYQVISGDAQNRTQEARRAINNMYWNKKDLIWMPGGK